MWEWLRGVPACGEADELEDHDERAWGGFCEGEAGDHFVVGEPVVVDGLLGDVGEDGVRAAEGDEGGFAEEETEVGEEGMGAEGEGGGEDGEPPESEGDGGDFEGSSEGGTRGRREDEGGSRGGPGGGGGSGGEEVWAIVVSEGSDGGGGGEDEDEGDLGEMDGDEGGGGDEPEGKGVEGFAADAERGGEDEGDDGGGEAGEGSGDPPEVLTGHVEPAEEEEEEGGGEDEEGTGGDAAFSAVETPAEVGGELLGLRAGEEHAEVEGVEEVVVGDPASAFDEFAVHEGDLAGGAAEAETAEPEPPFEGGAERGHGRGADGETIGGIRHLGKGRQVRAARPAGC